MKFKVGTKNKNYGFTIIETMIVLAIAGLMLTIVFVAVPQAQASRRDNERKTYLKTVYESQLEFLKNNGRIPTCIDKTSDNNGDGTPDDSDGNGIPDYTRDCKGEQAKLDAIQFVTHYAAHHTDPSTGSDYISGVADSVSDDTIISGNLTYHYNAGSVTHDQIPPVGQIEVGVGHWCAISQPDSRYPNWIKASEEDTGAHPETEAGIFYMIIGLERGRYQCLDNFSGVN